MKLSVLFTIATAVLATATGIHGGHGGHGPLVKRDNDIDGKSYTSPPEELSAYLGADGIAAFLESNGLEQRDTCESKCLPEMCIDEAIIKGSTTTVTYICPKTSTPPATLSKAPSTVLVTVTEYTTVPAPTSAITPPSRAVPPVSSSAVPMPVVTSRHDIPFPNAVMF